MIPDPRTTPVLSVPEAGRLLGLSKDTAYQCVRDGTIPSLRLGRKLVVPTARLLELLGLDAAAPADGYTTAALRPTA